MTNGNFEHGRVSFLGRMFMSIGDDSFIPSGTSLTCSDVDDSVQLSYENRRVGVESGTVNIQADGSAVIRHREYGILKIARGWFDIDELASTLRIKGEWLSTKNDAWGNIELLELRTISAP